MIVEYRLGKLQRKKYLWLPIAKLAAVIVVFTILSLFWFKVATENMVLVIAGTWSWVGLIHLLPLIILAVRHKQVSESASFVIDTENGHYRYEQMGLELVFDTAKIKKVVKVVSPPKYDDRMDFLGFGYFYYWKILLEDGTNLSLSCMLLDTEVFFGQQYEEEKQMFPMPKGLRI